VLGGRTPCWRARPSSCQHRWGPRNSENLAVADLEGDVLERDTLAETLRQKVDDKG
jgi:hypothetical protein